MLKVIKVACLVSFLPLGLLRTELLGEEDWINLLKGPELTGWKSIGSGEFSVKDGVIVVRGKRGYLLTEDEFKDFDFKCEVMTLPGSNSGIFFHTRSEGDRLKGGYEVQVNCTHRDPVKNGSIWGVVKSYDPIARDNEWFSLQITVRGKNIVTRVNDKIVVDYTEPDGITDSRRLGSGSIAIQAHDPKSVIRYRNLKIKKLAPPQPGGKRQKTQSQSARAGNRNVVFEDGFDSKLAEGWTWLKKNDKAWRFRDQALEIRNLEKQETVLACDVPDLKTGSYAIEVNLTSQPQRASTNRSDSSGTGEANRRSSSSRRESTARSTSFRARRRWQRRPWSFASSSAVTSLPLITVPEARERSSRLFRAVYRSRRAGIRLPFPASTVPPIGNTGSGLITSGS